MKTVKFRPELISAILNGEKHSTFRLFDDKNLSEGDTIALVSKDTLEQVAAAKITKAWEKPFGLLNEEDFEGHNPYASKEEMIETFRGYYGGTVDEHSVAKVIRFELMT